jgi:ParB-like chromosome segregation protein Spo0J
MPPIERTEKMTLRLTEGESAIVDQLGRRLGINRSGVMRMALLRLAKIEGVDIPSGNEIDHPHHKPKPPEPKHPRPTKKLR